MLYLGALILLTIFATLVLKKILGKPLFKKEGHLKNLESEYVILAEEKARLNKDSSNIEGEVNETVALYNITKALHKYYKLVIRLFRVLLII